MRMYPQPMTADADPLARLAAFVEQRITELGMEYTAVWKAAGFSDETLLKIRRGVRVRPTTHRKLEIALQWERGSVKAILDGGEPTPLGLAAAEDPAPSSQPAAPPAALSPSEALRRVIRSSARDLGITRADLDEVLDLVRQDLDDLPESPSGGTRRDLSDYVRERRERAGLSVQDVAAAAADPTTANPLIDADWLERLEQGALRPDEYPAYPQLDALVQALHLDPERVQELAGAQFMDVHTVWSDDGRVRTLVQGDMDAEDLAQVHALMRMYRRSPQKPAG